MSERLVPDDSMPGAGPGVDLPLHGCLELQALLSAARLVEADADEQEWTRVDPVQVPGLRRAAQLLHAAATLHLESAHGLEGTCPIR